METSWVDLLRRSPIRREILKEAAGVRVSEHTPLARVGTKKKRSPALTALLREQATQERDKLAGELRSTRAELEAALEMSVVARQELEEHRDLIKKLSSDNARLINQVEVLWRNSPARTSAQTDQSDHGSASREEIDVQLQGLRDALDGSERERRELEQHLVEERERAREEGRKAQTLEERLSCSGLSNTELEKSLVEKCGEVEGLSAHVKDLQSELSLLSHHTHSHHSPNNNTFIKDLERVTLRNAELAQSLAAAQHSRSVLEREVLAGKRSLLEAHKQSSQLEESLREVCVERDALSRCLERQAQESRKRVTELQQQVNTAITAKSNKVRELVGVGEELGGRLSSLAHEKDLLASSLRQEAQSNRRLAVEKASLECQLRDCEQRLTAAAEEVARLREAQVGELEVRCREVEGLRAQLEGGLEALQSERDSLADQLAAARSSCDVLSRERSSLETELSRCRKERGATESQVVSLSDKCEQLEREVGGVREEGRKKMEALSSQLAGSRAEAEQLLRERDTLTTRISHLEGQVQREHEEWEVERGGLRETLGRVTGDLDSALSELEATQTSNLLLKQQVSDLESQVGGLREQVVSRTELTNEMKALLDQRAGRIRQLEKTVEKQGEELSRLSNTSQDRSEESQSTSVLLPSDRSPVGSTLSLSRLSPSPSHTRYSSASVEVLHLKQTVSTLRQTNLHLEMDKNHLKTELAKLQGSVQALTTIRDRYAEEMAVLQRARQALEREREGQVVELSRVQEGVGGLEAEVEQLHAEREELQARLCELEEVCEGQAQELAALEELSHCASDRLETSGSEITHLQSELTNTRLQVSRMREVIDSEAGLLREEARRTTSDLCTLKAEALELRESSRVTEAVNVARLGQIEEREASVSRLVAEVEVLRARKIVVARYLHTRDEEEREREGKEEEEEGLRSENRRLQEMVQRLEEKRECEAEQELLQQQRNLQEAQREKELLQQQLERCVCGGVGGGGREERGGGGVGGGRREERLRRTLRLQVRQTNYLRVKLGYTLAELRLYKRLKVEMDGQLLRLQSGLLSSREQYSGLLRTLEHAELMGAH